MPKKPKYEHIRCEYFAWRMYIRNGLWYADGRSNIPSVGRHSLATRDHDQALKELCKLDRAMAVARGIATPETINVTPATLLSLDDGRRLYSDHLSRPSLVGGVRASTHKRYRSVFDKFLPFCRSRGIDYWNLITEALVNDYICYLEQNNYHQKTIRNEVVTIGQAMRWLISANYLLGTPPIRVKLRRIESQPAYCYTTEEVNAMVGHCGATQKLHWLGRVITALVCTGMRISELSALRWSDLDLESNMLTLSDESGYAPGPGGERRQLKSGRSRSFPIHPDLKIVVTALPCSDRFVFHGPRGGRLKPDTVRCVLIRDVIEPLTERFPGVEGKRSFQDGRLHSFRHYFCSRCVNEGIPELTVMDWMGHQESEMIRRYYHLHDVESHRRMSTLDVFGRRGA